MSYVDASSPLAYYYGRLRLRVMGICLEEEAILLIKHLGFGADGYLWSPPGGEVQFGESLSEALVREFYEETGLHIRVQKFLSLHEYLSPLLHAVECLFLVEKKSGTLRLGSEESTTGEPILSEARFFSAAELKTLSPSSLHQLLQGTDNFSELLSKQGEHTFCISR